MLRPSDGNWNESTLIQWLMMRLFIGRSHLNWLNYLHNSHQKCLTFSSFPAIIPQPLKFFKLIWRKGTKNRMLIMRVFFCTFFRANHAFLLAHRKHHPFLPDKSYHNAIIQSVQLFFARVCQTLIALRSQNAVHCWEIIYFFAANTCVNLDTFLFVHSCFRFRLWA